MPTQIGTYYILLAYGSMSLSRWSGWQWQATALSHGERDCNELRHLAQKPGQPLFLTED